MVAGYEAVGWRGDHVRAEYVRGQPSATKTQAEYITELVKGGVPFEQAWARTLDRKRIPVGPFLAAIDADERSPLMIAQDAGLHPDRTRMLRRQKNVNRPTAVRLCEALHMDPYQMGL